MNNLMMGKYFIIAAFLICFSVCLSGCIDISVEGMSITDIDMVSVNPSSTTGEIALCIDEDIYKTNFGADNFTKITIDGNCSDSILWSVDGILYIEEENDLWTLKLNRNRVDEIVVQEMYPIILPTVADVISYIACTDYESSVGSLNIYDKKETKTYTLIENIYYDYEWLPDQRTVAVFAVSDVFEKELWGNLLIKNTDNLSERIVFNGKFVDRKDYIDIRDDGKLIFSSDGAIYLYDLSTEEITNWEGPSGYDFRLPPSVGSNLKGYVLAKKASDEKGWKGQLYLVNNKGKIFTVPGWPIWINEPMIIYLDLESYDLFITNLSDGVSVNITGNFFKYYEY